VTKCEAEQVEAPIVKPAPEKHLPLVETEDVVVEEEKDSIFDKAADAAEEVAEKASNAVKKTKKWARKLFG